jgi:hypothetical protein
MIPCKLFKLSKNENALRTQTVEGVAEHPPIAGEPFAILGEAMVEHASARLVITSIVQTTRPQLDGSVEFDTMNSTYLYQPTPNATPVQ